jgi:hypothetical protein
MATRSPQAIQEHLETIVQGRDNQQQLVFDPRTSKLVVQDNHERLFFDPHTGQLLVQSNSEPKPNPDAVVADQVTSDGFFRRVPWTHL